MKVKLNLEGFDGNAFSLMGAFKRAARQQKADNIWVADVIAKCMSGSYDNLLTTLLGATEPEDDEEESNEEAEHLAELNRGYAKDRI